MGAFDMCPSVLKMESAAGTRTGWPKYGLGLRMFRCALAGTLSFAGSLAFSQIRPETNVVFVEGAVDKAVAHGVEGSGKVLRQSLIVHEPAVLEALPRFLANRFQNGLIRRGFTLKEHDTIQDSVEIAVVEVVPLECGIVYTRIPPSRWWKKSRIERSARVVFSLRVIDSSPGNLIWAGDAEGVRTDTIPSVVLDLIEQGGILLGKPDRPSSGRFARIAEPLAVLGVLGGLAYSFYAIRSR
jgi:hypothetical protein